MESGVKGFKSFLPKKNVKIAPSIGELLFCKIQKIAPTAVTLSAFKKNDLLKIETVDVPNMKTLMPGCVINFSIARIMNGLEGLIFDGSISAYANQMYLPSKISLNDSQIIEKQIKARIEISLMFKGLLIFILGHCYFSLLRAKKMSLNPTLIFQLISQLFKAVICRGL